MMQSNIKRTEFELHVAAEMAKFKPSFENALEEMGFRHDGLVGQGVVYPPGSSLAMTACPLAGLHMSWDSFERDEYVQRKNELDALWSSEESNLVGYAHGEIIKPEWDLSVPGQPFDASVPWPLEPFKPYLSTERKKWDIHVSAIKNYLSEGLDQVLLENAGMYYIDVSKSSGEIRRVFTIQGVNELAEGLEAFDAIVTYLNTAGGMTGSIKLEQTTYWRLSGNPRIVPPIVDATPAR